VCCQKGVVLTDEQLLQSIITLHLEFEQYRISIWATVGNKGGIKVSVFVYTTENVTFEAQRIKLAHCFEGRNSEFFKPATYSPNTGLQQDLKGLPKISGRKVSREQAKVFVVAYLHLIIKMSNDYKDDFRKFLNVLFCQVTILASPWFVILTPTGGKRRT
jgi:hypothetical protein